MNRIGQVLGLLILSMAVFAEEQPMSFFITSQGPGNGANLGGLAGADAHCQSLAAAVGAGNRSWHAYLSTNGSESVNARDRIGSGPWYNVQGVTVAENIEQLHGDNNLTKETVLTETAAMTNGRGDRPNRHDILTGSGLDGTASDSTCENWTSGADLGEPFAHHHFSLSMPPTRYHLR